MAFEPSTEDAAGGGVVLAIAEGGSDVMTETSARWIPIWSVNPTNDRPVWWSARLPLL